MIKNGTNKCNAGGNSFNSVLFHRWRDAGRKIISTLLVKSDQDPKLFVEAYDELVDYLHEAGHMDTMTEELKSKDVKIINFYDVCIDYILLDAIEVDLKNIHICKNYMLKIFCT